MMIRHTLRTTAPRLARTNPSASLTSTASRQRLLSGLRCTPKQQRTAAVTLPIILDKAVASCTNFAELNIPRGFGIDLDEDDDGT